MRIAGPVAIVGGGIGGLAAALALLRRGIDVTVYEQAPELTEIGAGIQISANGTRVLHALGLADDLAKVQVIPDGKEIRLWNTGQTWKLFDLGAESVARYGFPYITIHRGDLHQVLIDGRAPGKGGRHRYRPQMHRPDAARRSCRDSASRTAPRPTRHSSSAPTACIRWCGRACSGPTSRNSPASSPGAAWCRWRRCRRRSRAPRAPTGSVPARM